MLKNLGQEKFGAVFLRAFEDFVWCTAFHYVAKIKKVHAVSYSARKAHFMRDYQHGHAGFRQIDHGV